MQKLELEQKVVETLLYDGCKVIGTNYLKKNLNNKKNLEYYYIDITKEEEWKKLKIYLKKKYKKIDILINNAWNSSKWYFANNFIRFMEPCYIY